MPPVCMGLLWWEFVRSVRVAGWVEEAWRFGSMLSPWMVHTHAPFVKNCIHSAVRIDLLHRSCIRRTFDAKGLPHVSQLALKNCKDLLTLLDWNQAHGVR